VSARGENPLSDLVELTAAALHERAAYIVDHADDIGVRVRFEGRWQDFTLTEIPSLKLLLSEAFRLLLRAEVPHRRIDPDAPVHQVDVEMQGGVTHLPAEFREVARAANREGLDGFAYEEADFADFGLDVEKLLTHDPDDPRDPIPARFAMRFRRR